MDQHSTTHQGYRQLLLAADAIQTSLYRPFLAAVLWSATRRSSRATFGAFAISAMSAAVRPHLSHLVGCAPFFNKRATMSRFPSKAAYIRGDHRGGGGKSTSAPASSKSETIADCCQTMAYVSADSPFRFTQFGSALASSSVATARARPAAAATIRAVTPERFLSLTSTPARISARSAAEELTRDAISMSVEFPLASRHVGKTPWRSNLLTSIPSPSPAAFSICSLERRLTANTHNVRSIDDTELVPSVLLLPDTHRSAFRFRRREKGTLS